MPSLSLLKEGAAEHLEAERESASQPARSEPRPFPSPSPTSFAIERLHVSFQCTDAHSALIVSGASHRECFPFAGFP